MYIYIINELWGDMCSDVILKLIIFEVKLLFTYLVKPFSLQSLSKDFSNAGQFCDWFFTHGLGDKIFMFLGSARHDDLWCVELKKQYESVNILKLRLSLSRLWNLNAITMAKRIHFWPVYMFLIDNDHLLSATIVRNSFSNKIAVIFSILVH